MAEIAGVCEWCCFPVLLEFHVGSRRRALGWPLTVSQEERLSYCVGSPPYARRLRDFIETDVFNQIYFNMQLPASVGIASRIGRV